MQYPWLSIVLSVAQRFSNESIFCHDVILSTSTDKHVSPCVLRNCHVLGRKGAVSHVYVLQRDNLCLENVTMYTNVVAAFASGCWVSCLPHVLHASSVGYRSLGKDLDWNVITVFRTC